MVRFNMYDRNMEKIQADSKLFNLKTVNKIWVYGMRADNPVVRLRHAPDRSPDILHAAARILEPNGIQVVVESGSCGKADYSIGLRRDLRDHISLSSGIVQTIVYALEKKLRLIGSFDIPGVPSLPAHGTAAPATAGMPNFTPEGRHEGFLWQENTDSPIWSWTGGTWQPYVPSNGPSHSVQVPVEPEFI